MNGSNAIQTLTGLRLAIGLGAWLTPRLAGRLFGLDADDNPQSPYLGRLFGARDVALGAGLVLSEGDAQTLWLQAGLACDIADAAAGLAGGARGYLGPVSSALVTGVALGAAALGAAALREEGEAAPAATPAAATPSAATPAAATSSA